MKLVVGLGNPGKNYENTRHNIGFMVLDSFLKGFVVEKKFQAMFLKMQVKSEEVLFVKPLTFMNLSGDSVIKIVNYFHIDIKDILIIQDDLDLSFATIRFKKNSSSGGHNGIKSIIQCLGTQNFCRFKIGIAHDRDMDTVDYVLQKFSKKEMNIFQRAFPIYQEMIESWIVYGEQYSMAKYNNWKGI